MSTPFAANVLDIACGPGAQTLDLARLLPEATISAIDSHQPFVDEANRRALEVGTLWRAHQSLMAEVCAAAQPAPLCPCTIKLRQRFMEEYTNLRKRYVWR